MHKLAVTLIGAIALFGLGVVYGQGGQPTATAAPPPPAAPTDKAAYFGNTDSQSIWKDLEARQVLNKRVMEGGAYSINVRIVKEGDAPLVHPITADVWVVTAGTATAVTGGELVAAQQRPNAGETAGATIRGGVDQPLKAGDVLYVPPGVAHGFKDVKGFRGYLIRFDTK